eukprot:758960-Amphidinium_carterae.3
MESTGEAKNYDGKFRDPCPCWDGESPAERWRSVGRSMLWSEDTELAKTKQGVRLFTSLAGKAAQLAECLSDEDIKAADGLQKILEYFDTLYNGYLAIARDRDRDVEEAIYGGQIPPEESRRDAERPSSAIVNASLWSSNFKRYEVAHGPLPNEILGKLARIYTWLEGRKDFQSVPAALIRMDTDTAASSSGMKVLWQGSEDAGWDLQLSQDGYVPDGYDGEEDPYD